MFEDWTPRELAALNRATAWLRAYSSLKTELKTNIIKAPPMPLEVSCEDKGVIINYNENKKNNANERPL